MANCLIHAHRQFVELVNRFSEDCAHVIEQLGKVYHYDALAREQQMSADQRRDHHRQHSGTVVAELHNWCSRQIEENNVVSNSGPGKAITYMLKRWEN
jgi:hypothetical protein